MTTLFHRSTLGKHSTAPLARVCRLIRRQLDVGNVSWLVRKPSQMDRGQMHGPLSGKLEMVRERRRWNRETWMTSVGGQAAMEDRQADRRIEEQKPELGVPPGIRYCPAAATVPYRYTEAPLCSVRLQRLQAAEALRLSGKSGLCSAVIRRGDRCRLRAGPEEVSLG